MSYCAGTPYARGNNHYLPMCSNNKFGLGFDSHIRGHNTRHELTRSHVFPGTEQLGNESGANGPIFIFNDGVNFTELKRRYDGYGPYNYYHI